MNHFGLDLGGTKISAIALDEKGNELARTRQPTPKNYKEIVAHCVSLVREMEKQAPGEFTLGVGSPGVIDRAAGQVNFSPNIPDMKGKFLARDLEKSLGTCVQLANDAVCFALSESADGAAAGLHRVYGIILGTGVGGALAENGHYVPGPNTLFEWGHITLPWLDEKDMPMPRCACGRLGCIEAYLSGRSLHNQLSESIGRDITNDELNALLAKRVPGVMDVTNNYVRRLAKALAMLITILDPDALVLGGGVSNLDMLYEDMVRRAGKYMVVPGIKTKILKAKFGDDSGLRGAAWLGSK
ncbi:MAG: ROK family protein [Proteobacteria bacterium]|nr:ROK family protein [Pseudomonadota bacterium]